MTPRRCVVLPIPHYEMLLDAARIVGLGVEPAVSAAPRPGDIVFGAHGAPSTAYLPQGVSVYDTEHPSTWTGSYLSFLRSVRAYSYSEEGARMCGGTYLPLGHVPSLEAFLDVEKDIDVLFFGSLSPRRARVIERLEAAGLSVRTATPDRPVYGAERDAFVDSAKVVLNVHYYTDPPLLESSRVVPALHRHACVLSEEYVGEPLCAQVPYDDLVKATVNLCRDPGMRRFVTRAAVHALRRRPMPETLKGIL